MQSKCIARGVALGFIVAAFVTVPFNQAFAQQTVSMSRFDGGSLPPWAQATLARNESGVTYHIHTKVGGELSEGDVLQGINWKPGDVITNWIANFNDPAACTAPCGLDDILAELGPAPPRERWRALREEVVRPSDRPLYLALCSTG